MEQGLPMGAPQCQWGAHTQGWHIWPLQKTAGQGKVLGHQGCHKGVGGVDSGRGRGGGRKCGPIGGGPAPPPMGMLVSVVEVVVVLVVVVMAAGMVGMVL